jgi:Putative Actinobacterial Holin-X, holin superfamily III
VFDPWLAALIVGGAMFLLAGLLALLGGRQVKQAVPPVPESAAESVRADLDAVKAAVQRERGRQ